MDLLPLTTRWTDDVDPASVLPEYPRPQLRRPRWQSLNGAWALALVGRDEPRPTSFPREILVPFPIESRLGGVEDTPGPERRAWYRRSFEAPALGPEDQLRLHFGAVDWEAEVFVNGQPVGRHCGGFDPFHFDVTDALATCGPDELVVAVWDPCDTGPQPVGKQTLTPFGIQYTGTSGIWQTVWLEPVPVACIESVRARSDLARGRVLLSVELSGVLPGDSLQVSARAGSDEVASAVTTLQHDRGEIELTIPALRPWSPDDPFLHDLQLGLERDGQVLDRVDSYFGAREVRTERDEQGTPRLFLNGSPVLHLGPLDQGFWPDGLYTAPTDEALAFDLEATLAMGFNTIRKHVKVEPARWYWHADRLGVLVWQDMPSPRFDQRAFFEEIKKQRLPPDQLTYTLEVEPEVERHYRDELDAMLRALAPFPSIVVWVPFNEAWGQFATDEILADVAHRDPDRIVDGPSGWKDTGSGQVRDLHVYNREAEWPEATDDRPQVYGEFGGLKLAIPGHTAVEKGWGYDACDSAQDFAKRYTQILETVEFLVPRGLAGAIYTQTTDVESELNGLLTYDRRRFKIAPEALAELHRRILAGRKAD